MQDENEWPEMTGEELAHILALQGHEDALQKALDDARVNESGNWHETAVGVLVAIGTDPAAEVGDGTTEKSTATTRVEVLTEELMRAHYEEG